MIEIDGDSHALQEGYDEARTGELHGLGYSVMRFTNRDVMSDYGHHPGGDSEGVQATRRIAPHPNPLPQERGLERADM